MEKVKLPREVGEALNEFKDGRTFDTLMMSLVEADDAVPQILQDYWDSTFNVAVKLADAWRYGWEPLPKPEKKFYVFVPKTKRGFKYAILQDRVVVYNRSIQNECNELTKKQINHFSLEGYEREEVADD